MSPAPTYSQNLLLQDLLKKQRLNPSFSIRAYARYLGVQPPTLSAILKGKRRIPVADADRIASKLELTPTERERFLSDIHSRKPSLVGIPPVFVDDRTVLDDEKHFAVIAEWEHYAILSLMDTVDFRSDPKWVARRFGIPVTQVEAAIERMIDTGLLVRRTDGSLFKSLQGVRTTEDILSSALRKSHRETLGQAIQALESSPLELRDYSATTVAMDPSKLPEAKRMLREFRKKLADYLESGARTEVFQLAIQLFPQTRVRGGERREAKGGKERI